MYCKNCGKQIDDNAKFCQFCGSIVEKSKESKMLTNKTSKISEKTSIWLIFYAIYFVANVILLVTDYGKKGASKYFWPLGNSISKHYDYFSPRSYDWTEFLVYAILIPLIIYGFCRLFKYRK